MFSSLLIKDAAILDAESGARKRSDIFVENGVIASIGAPPRKEARFVLDAAGLVVTPGLVDSHAHLYHDSDCLGVDPEKHHLPHGVTYAIDQGSAGAGNYGDFRRRALARTGLRCKSFLNVSRIGMPVASLTGDGELASLDDLDEAAFAECFLRHADELLGVKIRLTPNICPHDPLPVLDRAVALAERLSRPLVVHPNQARTTMEEILGRLRPGDVLTHTYNGSDVGILDGDGRVRDCVRAARERGVVFDTGHGANSMSFPVLRQALAAGFVPDAISTDLHNANVNGPVHDMPTTISKFLCLGMPLHEAVRRTLHHPVRIFGLADKATSLEEGMVADIAGFELLEGEYEYFDAENNSLKGGYRLVSRFTVLGDRLFFANEPKSPPA